MHYLFKYITNTVSLRELLISANSSSDYNFVAVITITNLLSDGDLDETTSSFKELSLLFI